MKDQGLGLLLVLRVPLDPADEKPEEGEGIYFEYAGLPV